MGTILRALFCFFVLMEPAFAASCDDGIQEVDQALKTMELSDDERAQITDLEQQAVELCKSGKNDDANDVLAEAKAMLNIK